MDTQLVRFLEALNDQWRVDRYSVDEKTGKLVVHYVSLTFPDVEWSHMPLNPLVTVPRIGQVGMLGFIPKDVCDKIERQGKVR